MPAFFDGFYNAWLSKSPNLLMAPSVQFVLLVTGVYLLYVLFYKSSTVKRNLLLVFSLYFYYRLAGTGILALLVIAIVDYLSAQKIHASPTIAGRRFWYVLSITVCLSLLFISKYLPAIPGADMFLTVGRAYGWVSIIGISYYVFKSIGYVTDLYRGVIEKPEENFPVYLLYLSFFPSIVAGPIARAREFLPQLHEPESFTQAKASEGFWLIASGIFKKVVIADFIAVNFLDKVFESPQYFSGTEGLITLFIVPMQVFYDFSGYTDIALGVALLFGFTLKNNFNQPFRSLSVTDFWRRWHITLLDWLYDNVYNPLTFSLRSLRTAGIIIGIIVTFFLSGLWHGASVVFIVWGLLHACWLILEVLTKRLRGPVAPGKTSFGQKLWAALSFLFIAATFVLFKSTTLDIALQIGSKILQGFSLNTFQKWMTEYAAVGIVIVLGYVLHFLPNAWYGKAKNYFAGRSWYMQATILAVLFYIIYQFGAVSAKPFIYLEF
ncbi:MAG: MBOAT family protein [Ignavibacteriales bacterium]|nr:MBOAT family protein [Ignavibacteriales bacterium]